MKVFQKSFHEKFTGEWKSLADLSDEVLLNLAASYDEFNPDINRSSSSLDGCLRLR
jgi:hypothetical protein